MVTKDSLMYRQVFTLKDGAGVLLRPLTSEDYQALIALFSDVPPDEARFMRHDVSDPEVIRGYMTDMNYERVLPIIAISSDRIVGLASLHFNERRASHRAEIRIFLSKSFRRRGLGLKDFSGVDRYCQAPQPVSSGSACCTRSVQ